MSDGKTRGLRALDGGKKATDDLHFGSSVVVQEDQPALTEASLTKFLKAMRGLRHLAIAEDDR